MARKHKPRWGYRPPGFNLAAISSQEQAKRLAEIAGRSHPQSVKKLHRLLNEEGDAITVVDYMRRSEVSPPEKRAVLKALINHSHRLLEEANCPFHSGINRRGLRCGIDHLDSLPDEFTRQFFSGLYR